MVSSMCGIIISLITQLLYNIGKPYIFEINIAQQFISGSVHQFCMGFDELHLLQDIYEISIANLQLNTVPTVSRCLVWLGTPSSPYVRRTRSQTKKKNPQKLYYVHRLLKMLSLKQNFIPDPLEASYLPHESRCILPEQLAQNHTQPTRSGLSLKGKGSASHPNSPWLLFDYV